MDPTKPKTEPHINSSPNPAIISYIGFHILGLLVTLTMPFAGILAQLMLTGQEITLERVIHAQISQPMIWLIDFFAVLLAFFFIFNIQAELKRIQNVDQITGILKERSSELFQLKEKSQQDLSERFHT